MDAWESITLSQEPIVVCVTSTHGEGEPPDNAYKFWRFLKREARQHEGKPGPFAACMNFAVLALGSTDHNQFCAFGRELDCQLAALGGRRFAALGTADDATGLEAVVEPWLAALWPALKALSASLAAASAAAHTATAGAQAPAALPDDAAAAGPSSSADGATSSATATATTNANTTTETTAKAAAKAAKLPSIPEHASLDLRPAESDAPAEPVIAILQCGGQSASGEGGDGPTWLAGAVTHTRELTGAGAAKRVLAARIEAEALPAYRAGDAFSLRCPNTPADLRAFCSRLAVDPAARVAVRASSVPGSPPPPSHLAPFVGHVVALGDLLGYGVSLRAPPSKQLLRLLGEHSSDASESDALLHLASASGAAEYRTAVLGARTTPISLLQRFASCAPPLERVLDLLPPLAPRHYSATTAGERGAFGICFTVVREPADGLCTTWLAREAHDTQARLPLLLAHRPTKSFVLPADATVPLVLVCAGAGIAPFMGFLAERAAAQRGGAALGAALLFFGVRTRTADWLFGDELAGHLATGVLSAIHGGFSREPTCGRYVQAVLASEGAAVHALLWGAGGRVYICGDARAMAAAVQQALVDVRAAHGTGGDAVRAAEDVHALAAEGRLLRDVWA